MNELIFALKDNQLVSIEDVQNGKECGCFCPQCGEPLIAKKGAIKMHHFSHCQNSNCEYGYETSLHKLAKEIFEKQKSIVLPKIYLYDDKISNLNFKSDFLKRFTISNVYIEQFIENVKPDIVLEIENKKIAVEIFVTHKVDNEKLKKLKEKMLSTIEIDLSELNKDASKNNAEYIINEINKIIISEDDIRKYWVYNEKQDNYLEKHRHEIFKRFDSQMVLCPMYNLSVSIDKCKNCSFLVNFNKNGNVVFCSEEKRRLPACSDIKEEIKIHFPAGDKNYGFIDCPSKIYDKYWNEEKVWGIDCNIKECFKCSSFIGANLEKETMKCRMSKYFVTCPKCGNPLVKRNGKNGKFWGCSCYPKCKFTRDSMGYDY